jgi:hypothetical protein
MTALRFGTRRSLAPCSCYEEGLWDPDPQIRAIYIDHIVCTMSVERVAMRKAFKEAYISMVVEVLEEHRKY